MSTTINTNVSSLQAQNSLRSTNLNTSTAMERLSSGVRINSAKDDAAGLAISTRLTANIRGIAAAVRNANDGISLTQTAEGSLGQISDNLQRIRELAVQASNTGNNASDRAAMNNETKQLVLEIDRVASNASFNGIKLLDGSFQAQDLQIGTGSSANDRINVSIGSAQSNSLGVGSASSFATAGTGTAVGGTALAAGGLAINGQQVGAAAADGVSNIATVTGIVPGGFATPIADGNFKVNGVSIGALAGVADAPTQGTAVAAAINAITAQTGVAAVSDAAGVVSLSTADGGDIVILSTLDENVTGFASGTTSGGKSSGIAVANAINAVTTMTGVTATVAATKTSGTTVTGFATALTAGDVKINGVDLGAIAAAGSAAERGGQVAAAVNSKTAQTGVTATFNTATGAVALNAADGRNIVVQSQAAATAIITGLGSGGLVNTTTRSAVTLASTTAAGITISDVNGSSAASTGLTVGFTAATATAGAGVSSLDLTTAGGAQAALSTLDSAISTITDSRASMGAYQNRLTAAISNLETTSLNVQASRSRILDTDYAKETTILAKSQIISQAATAMLAQANQSGQSVLALLK